MSTSVKYPQLEDVTLRNPAAHNQQQQQGYNGSTAMERQNLRPQVGGPKRIRYFSVGRSTDKVLCPGCREHAPTEEHLKSNPCDTVNGYLCCLSCCFPIFALSCLYICCASCLKTPRRFCAKCGCYLGFQSRPV